MDAMSATADPAGIAAFTAAGQPFELTDAVVRGTRCRVFRNAPRTLNQLYAQARSHQAQVFTVADGARLTYGEVFARAAALAADLAAHGVGRGTHVAIAMRNCPEWVVAFIAVTALAAVPVLVNSRGAAEEIAASLADTGCRHAVADARRAALIERGRCAGISGVVVDDIPAVRAGGPAWRCYQQILAREREAPLPAAECAPEDPAAIMFTSGTSGRPKGAVLSHIGMLTALMANQLCAAMLGARMAASLGIDVATLARAAPQACTLLVFPLFHTSGCLSVFLTSLTRGGRIVFLPRWSAAEALRLVQQERVTALPAVPTMLWDLLHSPELAGSDTSSLVNLGTGGQGLPANLLQAIRAAFPRAILGTGYGMTETNGMVSLALGEEYLAHPESVGRPLPTAEIRIVDDADRELPAGATGEVCIRSAQNMNGYWAHPEADAERLRGGWLHSGDLGRIDAHGRLHIVARKTDMVISAGENIYCAEVERVLTEHPHVLEAATFGVPDERLGERLIAVIVARAGSGLDAAQLGEFCRTRLADYKLPRSWHFERGPLERNAAGKLLKAQLRARVGAG
jgi:acyl-CoA synthetase (AMP-forming)/AMP-acid ligase II